MLLSLALLYASLAPGCTGLPASADAAGAAAHSVVDLAHITLVHISKLQAKLQVVAEIEVGAPLIEGLTGISRDLGHLESELKSPFTDLLGQVEADVSSLGGRVRSLAAAMNCSVQARPTAAAVDRPFPHSRLYLTLVRVQHYLGGLIQNKDKLKVC